MYTRFLNISPDKQDRIVNAALKEFAQKGYQLASTNEIVKEAEISKGMLFHYFNNKKALYLYLYDHVTEVSMGQLYARINWDEKDLLIRYQQVARLKFELFEKYPEIFNFLKGVYKEDTHELIGDLEQRKKKLLESSLNKLFADIDLSKFRDGTDISKAISIINWTLEGFAYQQQSKVTTLSLDQIDLEAIFTELDLYIEMLRQSFYK